MRQCDESLELHFFFFLTRLGGSGNYVYGEDKEDEMIMKLTIW